MCWPGTLEVGAVSESMSAQAEAPGLQTETHEVSATLLARELTAVPLAYYYARRVEVFADKPRGGGL